MDFISPSPLGSLSSTSSVKKSIYTSFPNDSIVAPSDGVITKADPSTCDGLVQIEHVVNNQKYYSNICKVGRISTFPGKTVSKNETVGYFGTNPIEYTILDKYGDKNPISDFTKQSTSNQQTQNQQTQKQETKTTSSSKYDSSSNTSLYNAAMNFYTKPFELIHSMLTSKSTKESVENKEKLIEEINRINKLIKD